MQRLKRALKELSPAIYIESRRLNDFCMLDIGSAVQPYETPIPARDKGEWTPVHPGVRWGGYDLNAWFHATADIPEDWVERIQDESRSVVLRLLLGQGDGLGGLGWPEGLLYVNGRLQQGINRHHPDVLLRQDDVRAGMLTFDVRAWSGMLPDDHRIETAEIALLDHPTERLYHLLDAGSDLVEALDESDPLLYELAEALDAAYDSVELFPATFYGTARVAVSQLEAALYELSQRYQPADRPIVTAVGHGHLDVAWLWQTRHAREKAARTFAIATALMDAYPEYVFLHTTPQVFAWLKDDYPTLYERVRARVDEGRFEVAGAMWVESDCNLVSGESLVRQILYGQQFLREEFGREYSALWLPDAFGYSAALPQIMLRAGIPVFMTTKLSWSETNRIPADTFHWRGIDGSTILTHFLTTPALDNSPPIQHVDTYHSAMIVPAVLGVWQRYRQKLINKHVLLTFGHSDGGAGPTRQHLEHARAIQQLPGMPELHLGRADEYFDRLRATVDDAPDLPVWDGDLYLEYHRGTYTTQSWLKRTHRQLEGALLLAEWLDAWQWALHPNETPNRRSVLDAAWRTLLMHEFHDILPGSSIATVYWDARLALTDLGEELVALTHEMLAGLFALAPHACTVALNPSPFARSELVALSDPGDGSYPLVDGQRLPMQPAADDVTALVELSGVPGRGVQVIEWASGISPADGAVIADPIQGSAEAGENEVGIWLKNVFFAIQLNEAGEIVSLEDHRVDGGRQLIAAGKRANVLTAYEDLPRDFDAWDIDAYYARKPYPLETTEVSLVERGPLRAVVHVMRKFRSSAITQRIMLYRSNPRIDFETQIDWHEQHVLLKAGFPLDVRTSHATCEIQFGAIERPVHRNTSWDQARFEIPAHRWVDLSEGDYGVSLLNDGRYGHDVAEGWIGLTLLRSPTWPDPQADQGEHTLIYSLYPHPGDWRTGGTVAAGYALNRPLVTYALRGADSVDEEPSSPPAVTHPSAIMFTTDVDGVVIEAIKRSQDGQHVVVRLYEACGNRTRAVIHSAQPFDDVIECDLQERPLTSENGQAYAFWLASAAASHDPPVVDGQRWSCEFRPFEIRTFRVALIASR